MTTLWFDLVVRGSFVLRSGTGIGHNLDVGHNLANIERRNSRSWGPIKDSALLQIRRVVSGSTK